MMKRLCLSILFFLLCCMVAGCITPSSSQEKSGDAEALMIVMKRDGNGEAKWGYLDGNGEIRIPLEYQKVSRFYEGLAAVKKDGKWGCINPKGEVAIDFAWDFIGAFSNGAAPAYLMVDGKLEEWFIDAQGNKLFLLAMGEKDFYTDFYRDRLLVCLNGKYGYMDKSGKMVIPAIYDQAYAFGNGIARVFKDEKCGCIDRDGNIVIPLQFRRSNWVSEDLVAMYPSEHEAEIYSTDGSIAFELDDGIVDVDPFVDGKAQVSIVEKDSSHGYNTYTYHSGTIDSKGHLIAEEDTASQDEESVPFSEVGQSHTLTLTDDTYHRKYVFTDKAGNQGPELNYDWMHLVVIDGKDYGFYVKNTEGENFQYTSRYGLVDPDGKEITSVSPGGYLRDRTLRKDGSILLFSLVFGEKQFIIINKRGETIWPLAGESAIVYDSARELVWFQKDGKYGVINFSSQELVPPIYDLIDWLYPIEP